MPVVRSYSASSSNEPQEAFVWLNVGFTTPDGEFVTLPFGIPLDTMQEAKVRGTDPHWRSLMQAKNSLLQQLISMADRVQPGESKILKGLQVQLYKKAEADETQEVLFELPAISFED